MSKPLERPTKFRTIVFGRMTDGREAFQILVRCDPTSPCKNSLAPVTSAQVLSIVLDCTPSGWVVPDEAEIAALLHTLNVFRDTVPEPDPVPGPVDRVKAAISTLLAELPAMVKLTKADQERSAITGEVTFLSAEQTSAVEGLLTAAVAAKDSFYWPKTPRTRVAEWHKCARAIAFHGRSIWRENKPGAGLKETSPVVALIERLLPLAGCGSRTPAAIVQGIARARRSQKSAWV